MRFIARFLPFFLVGILACSGDALETECTQGSENCPCGVEAACSDATLQCVNGVCVTCPTGTPDCPCYANGACELGPDGVQYSCQSETCKPAVCTGPDCADTSCVIGSCDPEYRCDAGQCEPCKSGTEECSCDASGACDESLRCFNNVCVKPDLPGLPVGAPLCYTPCTKSYVNPTNGEFRSCNAGLMDGCVADATCIQGTCHVPDGGSEQGQCKKAQDCPTEFQACVVGACISNCTKNEECREGHVCDSKVCRLPCSNNGNECPSHEFCSLSDGVHGTCLPKPDEASAIPPVPTLEPFQLQPEVLKFSNVSPWNLIRITNNGNKTVIYTVRRLSHSVPKGGAGEDRVIDRLNAPESTLAECGDGECNSDFEGCSSCPEDCSKCPLDWIGIGAPNEPVQGSDYELTVEPGDEAHFEVRVQKGQSPGGFWDGQIEVLHPTSGSRTIQISFRTSPQGQWTGKMYRFGQFGTKNLKNWKASLGTLQQGIETSKLDNALLQKWIAFRGDTSGSKISWAEFQAVLTATTEEQWVNSTEEPKCAAGLCYPYHGGSDPLAPELVFKQYTTSQDTFPIPEGVVSSPFSMNIRPHEDAAVPNKFVGRINTEVALQYAGNPAVSLTFATDPTSAENGCVDGKGCFIGIDDFHAVAAVGGRYVPGAEDADCTLGWPNGSGVKNSVPWLVPGFRTGTVQNDGVFVVPECRDQTIPYLNNKPQSASLSSANPIPDGAARVRTLSILEGAMINENTLFLLFEERFSSYLGKAATDFVAYGFMQLGRSLDLNNADFEAPATYEGTVINAESIEAIATTDILAIECSEKTLEGVLGASAATLSESNAGTVVSRLLGGAQSDTNATFIKDPEIVHYYCESTGNFDQGPSGSHPCPADGGLVTYFTVDSDKISSDDIKTHECQSDNPFKVLSADADAETNQVDPNKRGYCINALNAWIAKPTSGLKQVNPVWKCKDDTSVLCDDNRFDLSDAKEFYEEVTDDEIKPLLPIRALITQAFRYKTQFKSRSGANVGFAPEICIPNSNAKPYCYDPVQIETIQARSECLLHIWQVYRSTLLPKPRSALVSYLKHSFSYLEIEHWLCETNSADECPAEDKIPLPSSIEDGFEHNLAELLIMMGDESKTQASSSRFDLSDSKAASFDGHLFEPGGSTLSSVAGFEMHSLYQAVQYYRMVLNRFYAMGPLIQESVNTAADGLGFVSPKTVSWYVKKVVLASTALSDTWSQIATRYGAINESEIARKVIERAYTSSYLEGVIMNRMMQDVIEVIDPKSHAEIRAAVIDSQRRYAWAMREMSKVYGELNAERSFFGISPDLVPIPQSQGFKDSPFEVLYARFESQLLLAKTREDLAINSSHEYEVDEAAFGTELANIRNTYENQLVELCGTMVNDDDGQVYPAIRKYAHLNSVARLLGDPCGGMETGEIYEAQLNLELTRTDLLQDIAKGQGTIDNIENETKRVSKLCKTYFEWADYKYEKAGERISIEEEIKRLQVGIQHADRVQGVLGAMGGFASCTPPSLTSLGNCPTKAIATTVFAIGTVVTTAVISGLDIAIASEEHDLAELDRDLAKWDDTGACDLAKIDSDARMADLLVELKIQNIEMLKAQKTIALRASTVEQLLNKSKRIQLQHLEAEELSINAAAAKTDPNVRILKNDSVKNAELSFKKAMQAAYRMTLVYEYYTSMSYENAADLYLIRMVGHGQPNLENYGLELQNAFYEFEQAYGVGEERLLVVSLMNDIMQIPRLNSAGQPISGSERLKLYRSELTNQSNRNDKGWLVFGFNTGFGSTSPISRVHKISEIHANIEAYREGDQMAMLYVQQKGTSTIYGLDDKKRIHDIPARTALIHAKQNADGLSFAGPELYVSKHLAGRPLINNGWKLVINDQDEPWNLDDQVQDWGDIKLYIHYTDFTGGI